MVGWGSEFHEGASPPSGLDHVVAIAAGSDNSLALKRDGTVVGWGDNDYGQSRPPPGLRHVTAISAALHSLAIAPPRTPTTLVLRRREGAEVRATLTRADTHAAIPGRQIRFRDVGPLGIRLLCVARTDAQGLAACESAHPIRHTLSARFTGNGRYAGAIAPTP